MAGVSLAEIKDLLGHSSITVTEQYAYLAPDNLRAAVDKQADIKKAMTICLKPVIDYFIKEIEGMKTIAKRLQIKIMISEFACCAGLLIDSPMRTMRRM